MRSLLALLLALPLTASAVDPGDRLYASERLDALRFADSDEPGPAFSPGASVTVLVVEGERLRVLGADGKIGWVEAAKVVSLGELPDDVRETFRRFALEGQDYATIAAHQGIPKGTVGARIHRARARLRTILLARLAEHPE